MKYLLLSIFFSPILYSQVSRFNYSSIVDRERDKKEIAHYIDIPNTFKNSKSTVITDDDKKTITISRKYVSKNGEPIDESKIMIS